MNNVGNPLYILNNKMQKNSPNQAKKKTPKLLRRTTGGGKYALQQIKVSLFKNFIYKTTLGG